MCFEILCMRRDYLKLNRKNKAYSANDVGRNDCQICGKDARFTQTAA